jgi:hypothetical protein
VIARAVTGLSVALTAAWSVTALYIDVRLPGLRIPLVVALYSRNRVAFWSEGGRGCWASLFTSLVSAPSWRGGWGSSRPIRGRGGLIRNGSRGRRSPATGSRSTTSATASTAANSNFSNCWGERTVSLASLTGLDLCFVNSGMRWTDDTIASFQFSDGPPVAFSVEPRYRESQLYVAIAAFPGVLTHLCRRRRTRRYSATHQLSRWRRVLPLRHDH